MNETKQADVKIAIVPLVRLEGDGSSVAVAAHGGFES
jgi:hypothetical protein